MTESIERGRAQLRPDRTRPLLRSRPTPRRLAARARATLASTLACVGLAAAILTGLSSAARAGCVPDPPTADGDTITCTGNDSTGYDASAFDDLTITVEPFSQLDESDPGLDSAIRVNQGSTITLEPNSTVTVTEAAGFGIRGADENRVTSNGLIRVEGDDGRAVSIGSRSDAARPGRLENAASGGIQLLGDRSVGLEAGDDVDIRNAGSLSVGGSESRGISVGNRTDLDFASTVENSGGIDVTGAGAFGIRVGDGWYRNDVVAGTPTPVGTGVDQLASGSIDVSGPLAYGLYLGRDANALGNHNSFATTAGTIDVTGNDAIGISLGGNDLVADPADSDALATSLLDSGLVPGNSIYTLLHQGAITGGPDAGPLVEFRNFASGENRILVFPDAEITADLTNQGSPDRALAIRGSAGREFIVNFGDIRGDVVLAGGDDRFAQLEDATFDGRLDGGAGVDELILSSTTDAVGTFDVSQLANFEWVRVGGGRGWSLTNAAGFGGTTRVEPGGRLVAATPTTLGGDLEVAPDGTIEVRLDGGATPLSVAGTASLDGTLVVDPDPGLTPGPTPYRVLQAGVRNGEFAAIDVLGASGIRTFTPTYDATGLSLLYEVLPITSLAQGRNNQAVLAHLIEIGNTPGSSGDVLALFDELGNLTSAEANGAFNALSPEAYDAQTSVVVEGGRRVARLLLDRPRECTPGRLDPWTAATAPLPCHPRRWSPWIAAVGGFRSREAFAGHPRYDASLGGLVVGIDGRPLEGLELTFALASQRGTVNVAIADESTLTLTDVAGHAAWTRGPLRVQSVLSWGHGFHDDKRQIRFVSDGSGGETNVRADTDHDSDRLTLASEVGLALDAGPILVEPLAVVDWSWVWQRALREGGAGGFGLRVDDRSDSIGSISAGVRASTVYHHTRYLARQLEWMDGVWRPQIDLRWRQMLAGTDRDVDARLLGAPASVPGFTIEGKEDDGGFEIGAGVSFVPARANRLQFDLRYEAFVASHTLDQNLTGRVLLGF